MLEFALLIDNKFIETRIAPEKPVNIPHKKVVWLPVVRRTGNTEVSMVENEKWVIQTLVQPSADVATVSARQARLALLNANLLDDVESLVATQPASVRITWEYATEISRDNIILNQLAVNLGLTEEDLDNLFDEARQL